MAYNIGPKGARDSTIILSLASDIFMGIGSEEVTQQSAIADGDCMDTCI
jgi:hypothetical protein